MNLCALPACPKTIVEQPLLGLCPGHLARFHKTGTVGSILTCTHLRCPEPPVAVIRHRYNRHPWHGCIGHHKAMASALAIGSRVDDSGVTVQRVAA